MGCFVAEAFSGMVIEAVCPKDTSWTEMSSKGIFFGKNSRMRPLGSNVCFVEITRTERQPCSIGSRLKAAGEGDSSGVLLDQPLPAIRVGVPEEEACKRG